MDTSLSSWTVFWSRLLRLVVTVAVVGLLLNDGVRYTKAWFAIYLCHRDAGPAIDAVVQRAPADRSGAASAAQYACWLHGAVLESYSHEYTSGVVGESVEARLQVSHPVTGSVLTPVFLAVVQDRTPFTWRSKSPMVRFSWQQQFGRM